MDLFVCIPELNCGKIMIMSSDHGKRALCNFKNKTNVFCYYHYPFIFLDLVFELCINITRNNEGIVIFYTFIGGDEQYHRKGRLF